MPSNPGVTGLCFPPHFHCASASSSGPTSQAPVRPLRDSAQEPQGGLDCPSTAVPCSAPSPSSWTSTLQLLILPQAQLPAPDVLEAASLGSCSQSPHWACMHPLLCNLFLMPRPLSSASLPTWPSVCLLPTLDRELPGAGKVVWAHTEYS